MAFPIIPKKRSGATGSPTSLTVGELAVNTATGELFLGGDEAVLLLNPPTAAGTTATERTGDGTTTAFTFSGYNGNADGGYLVSVGGIDQPPSKYAVTSIAGGTITFVEAPTAGELISIRALVASGGGGGSGTVTSITAGEGLDGGTITESGTISMPDVGTPQTAIGGGLVIPVISTDAQGRVTALTTVACPALTTAQIAGLSTTAPAALATSAVVGLSTFAARADHQHLFPSAANVGALGATASASGDLTGNYPGPTLAAITTAQSNVGSSSRIPILSIDAKGRVTALSSVLAAFPYSASVLVVAGGGGGTGAGGGAGGMASTSLALTTGDVITATVGAGGAGVANYGATGNSGSNSTVSVAGSTTTALAGGAGGAGNISGSGTVGQSGGSGGGGGANGTVNNIAIAGGSGTVGQGSDGGATPGLAAAPCGGGGGAGAVGAAGTSTTGGAGGIGSQSSITGALVYYAGGGGGSRGSGTQGTGGTGGGGAGVIGPTGANNGTVNTGGGGGGANSSGGVGGSGGSGVVILSLLTSSYTGTVTGSPTVTTSGSNTIIKFTSSGTYTA